MRSSLWGWIRRLTGFKATPGKRQASSLVKTGQKIVINPSICAVRFEQEARKWLGTGGGLQRREKDSKALMCSCVAFSKRYLFVYLAARGLSCSLWILVLSAKLLQLCPTLCNPMDCSLPGFSVHGILQARILEWAALPSSRGSSRPRDQTQVSCFACRFFTVWTTRELFILILRGFHSGSGQLDIKRYKNMWHPGTYCTGVHLCSKCSSVKPLKLIK